MQDNDARAAARKEEDQGARRKTRYRHAAVGYFVYGLIYLSGAVFLSTRGEGPQGGWIWFGVGAVMVLLFPVLIWKELKWVTRILAVLVGIRIFGLLRLIFDGDDRLVEMPWGDEMPILYGAVVFVMVAAAECYLLVRAGWDR